MHFLCSILLVLCLWLTVCSSSTAVISNDTCVNLTSLSFIENSLATLRSTVASTATVTQLASLQSQVLSLSSDVKKIYYLLRHANMTINDEEEPPSSLLLPSCEAILSKWPNSPSGYYSLADVNGHTRHVYCHMETLCGKGGGWRRIASLNMKNSNEKCPSQFRMYSQGGVRACGRPVTNGGSCVGITFSSKDIKYSQVCGKVIGYQVGWPDAADANRGINSQYVDGVSLTHGYPRKHIWTLMSGAEDRDNSNYCPCGSRSSRPSPSFVGSHYYCEAGYQGTYEPTHGTFYYSDPLWDGKECGSSETICCQRTLIPWFYRSLGYTTTDSIEMRICLDDNTNDEDVAVGQYEIYIR